ncbi:hypothetical protein B0A48_00823 [Cryoendolithus antarcticus]|uniref:Uncharacterized protein n=1 Tax=Cryoendolithus antarcticus TaxID=1507870 RepID=A0A1V8TRN1_9PEZI|nr:hypothetical protein B0A48_00823 [Cryoendolithus antarcticus]
MSSSTSFADIKTAQVVFNQQFDLSQPDEAMMSYQKYATHAPTHSPTVRDRICRITTPIRESIQDRPNTHHDRVGFECEFEPGKRELDLILVIVNWR